MKESIVIKRDFARENDEENGIIMYGVYLYIEDILNNIFNIEDKISILRCNNNRFMLCDGAKKVCEFSLDRGALDFYLLNIYNNNSKYVYTIDFDLLSIKLKLREQYIIKEDKKYQLIDLGYSSLVDINKNKRGIGIEIVENNLNKTLFNEIINNIEVDDSLEVIYDKLNPLLSNNEKFSSLKIEKYKILDTVDSRKEVTDLIGVTNGILLEYLNTIIRNNKKFVVKKEYTNYIITCVDTSIEELPSTYFEVNDSVRFIKKLEKRK